MENIIKLSSLSEYATEVLRDCLDYIADHRIASSWAKNASGWQEQWNQSKFTGLFATCHALLLLTDYPDRYSEVIKEAVEEMKYMFDESKSYNVEPTDTKEEKKRKDRCKILLEQNFHTTLKAVYFLRTYENLTKKGIVISSEETFNKIITSAYEQVGLAFNEETGFFAPALDNNEDVSIQATSQAFVLMKDYWGANSPKVFKTKKELLNYIDNYISYSKKRQYQEKSKFEVYGIKTSFVSALNALSLTPDILTDEEREMICSAFFASLSDVDLRSGFAIKDSYSVPNTTLARDAYITNSRILYLNSVVQLIKNKFVPLNAIKYILDDIVEIIDTSKDKKRYLDWDSTPSFSHNLKALTVLKTFIDLFKEEQSDHVAYKISPHIPGSEYHSVDPTSVALFMSFSKDNSDDIQKDVQEVLSYIGFEVWWASKDSYDSLVVDNIFDRLSKSQFVIVECSERSANVMYEAGLAHGLGKPTLLCGCSNEVFPYESSELFNTCIFEPDGEINPPPYRDLQKGIANFIINKIDDFSLTDIQKRDFKQKAENFIKNH